MLSLDCCIIDELPSSDKYFIHVQNENNTINTIVRSYYRSRPDKVLGNLDGQWKRWVYWIGTDLKPG